MTSRICSMLALLSCFIEGETDPNLRVLQILWSKGIGFSDDGYKIDPSAKTFHHLDIERFNTALHSASLCNLVKKLMLTLFPKGE